jgi:hypothetical protein
VLTNGRGRKMKIKVTISREYDTEGENHADLFEGIDDEVGYALRLFSEDVDNLVKYNEVRDNARVEVSNV